MRRATNRSKTTSVNDKVMQLLRDGNESDSSDEKSSCAPKVTDFDEDEYELPDVKATDRRKRNIKLLSEDNSRYSGEISLRNGSDNESESSNSNKFDYESSNEESDIDRHSSNSDNLSESDLKNDSDCEESKNIDQLKKYETKKIGILSQSQIESDVSKGACIHNQLRIWERLLELRIQMQKLMNTTNVLPSPYIFNEYKVKEEELNTASKNVSQNVGFLLNRLLTLQRKLFLQQTDVKEAMKNSLKRSAKFDDEAPLPKKVFEEHLAANHDEFQSFRNKVLLKWDDRTKLLAGEASINKKLAQHNICEKIETALLNKSSLIRKSQNLLPGTDANKTDDETDLKTTSSNSHVYNDSEFYHQQLRELIEYKSNSSMTSGEVTKLYTDFQKMRQKLKKKVDTKASKGRALRYAVHNKLINFMAPDTTYAWTSEAINELTKSLFV